MNERIRELGEQAMTATTNKFSADREWSADEWRDFYDTKFAELIVKECGVALSPMLRDMVSRGQAFDLIKDHFGVEE